MPGQVTDDTQMSLALGDALLAARGWDLRMVADAFVGWMRSKPPDIGHACLYLEQEPGELLAGDGWGSCVKPFRTIGGLHLLAAVGAWLLEQGRSTEAAMQEMRAVRPGMVVRPEIVTALRRYERGEDAVDAACSLRQVTA